MCMHFSSRMPHYTAPRLLQSLGKSPGDWVRDHPNKNTGFWLCKLPTPPLMPLTAHQEVTLAEKRAIMLFFYLRYSFTAISLIAGWHWSTVRNCVTRATDRQSLEINPCSNTPCSVTWRQWRWIMRAVKKDRQITRAELRDMYAPNGSLSTIHLYLCQNNYGKWLQKKWPKLENKHVFQRLQWALEQKHWTNRNWEWAIWSDECSVGKSDSGLQIWVFRQPPEKWFKDCIAPKQKGNKISFMLWGCFWGRNWGTFCPVIVKSVNKGVYVKLLEYLLLSVLKRVHETLGDSIFQHDNTPVHNAAVGMDFFEKYNFQVEDWSSYCPDLNPIEHVWVNLQRRLHRKYPAIGNTKTSMNTVKARLAEVLSEIWKEIPEAYFKQLRKSMPDRVAAVINNMSWDSWYCACNCIQCFSRCTDIIIRI